MRILDLRRSAPAVAAAAMLFALPPGQALAGLFDFGGSTQQQRVTLAS